MLKPISREMRFPSLSREHAVLRQQVQESLALDGGIGERLDDRPDELREKAADRLRSVNPDHNGFGFRPAAALGFVAHGVLLSGVYPAVVPP